MSFQASWEPLGTLRGVFGASWGSLGAFWRHLGGFLAASWRSFGGFGWKIGVGHRFVRFPFSGRAVLKASWGHFLVFGRPFGRNFGGLSCHRLHSKPNMQNRRFTCILCTQGRFFRIFGRSKTLYFSILLALEGHFDCIFTVKS